MNKTNLLMAGLLVAVASLAFLPSAEAARDPTIICIYDPIHYTRPWCGSEHETWGTVQTLGYCITTNVNHPLSGC